MTDPVERLYAAVLAARSQDPASSRTAKLMSEGVVKMAKKLVEEAVEVGLDAVQGERKQVVEESADLLYNLAVLWAAAGIAPADVWREMDRREQLYGMAEKLPKQIAKQVAKQVGKPVARKVVEQVPKQVPKQQVPKQNRLKAKRGTAEAAARTTRRSR